MQRRIALSALVAVGVAACSATSGPARSSSPGAPTSVGTARPSPPSTGHLTAKQTCRRAVGSADLIAWADGTVAQFRSYRYGGPTPTEPLAHAFPGLPGNTRAAWCGTAAGRHATHWWATVVHHTAASVITIHGPGEGIEQGRTDGPPRVP